MNKPNAAIATAIANTPVIVGGDKLDQLRNAARTMRDLDMEIDSLEELIVDKKAQLNEMKFKQLPDLFDEAGVRAVTIEAEGNMPAYEAKASPYYHANIKNDWPDEQKIAAFNWLENEGHGDLIKTVLKIELGRGDREKAKLVEDALVSMKIDYDRDLTVPWNTLTSFVREQVEEQHTTPPLELLGATVGRVVKLKAAKAKK